MIARSNSSYPVQDIITFFIQIGCEFNSFDSRGHQSYFFDIFRKFQFDSSSRLAMSQENPDAAASQAHVRIKVKGVLHGVNWD